jgi:hypothetical protein
MPFRELRITEKLSFPRRRESMLSHRTCCVWIPAFAGMTGISKFSSEYTANLGYLTWEAIMDLGAFSI